MKGNDRYRHDMLLAAAAGAVSSCVVSYGCYCYWMERRRRRRYRVPLALLQSPYGQHVQTALQLALQAGTALKSYCDARGTAAEKNFDLKVETKSNAQDFCTKLDVANETLIVEGLLKTFPTHKIIGEESTGTGTIPPLTKEPTWIIDPIDGTTNFAAGLPLACVSIGWCLHKRPVVGVVYAPITDEVYLAVRNHGAFRNGVQLCGLSNDYKPLHDAVVGVEFGYVRQHSAIASLLDTLQRIMEHGTRTTRQLGSGVLDLCYVASRRLDVVYAGVAGEGWKPWDYCAGFVIAKEAGCAVEAIEPKMAGQFDIYSDSIICAGSQELLEELRFVIEPK